MSNFYTLHTNALLSIAEIESVIGSDYITHKALNLDVHPHSARTADIINDLCH